MWGFLVVHVTSDTVLDVGDEFRTVRTVAELDRHLDRISEEVTSCRVPPVEVALWDPTDAEAPALVISVGGLTSYAVYLSRAGDHFVSAGPGTATRNGLSRPVASLIPGEQARQAMRQFATHRRRPQNITWQLVPPATLSLTDVSTDKSGPHARARAEYRR